MNPVGKLCTLKPPQQVPHWTVGPELISHAQMKCQLFSKMYIYLCMCHGVCVRAHTQHVRTYSFLLHGLWELNVVVILSSKHYPRGAIILA